MVACVALSLNKGGRSALYYIVFSGDFSLLSLSLLICCLSGCGTVCCG